MADIITDIGILGRQGLEQFHVIFTFYMMLKSDNVKVRKNAEANLAEWRARARPTSQEVPFIVSLVGVWDTVGAFCVALGVPNMVV